MAGRLRLVLGVVAMALLASCSKGDDSGEDRAALGSEPDAECEALEQGAVDQTLMAEGTDRAYRVSLPDRAAGADASPLILNLHGFGGTIEDHDSITDLPEIAGAEGYVVVTPQAENIDIPDDGAGVAGATQFDEIAFWNFFGSTGIDFPVDVPIVVDSDDLGTDDVGFLTAVLDDVAVDYCTDPDRVFIAGMSNGAGMAVTLACEAGDRIAGIAAVSGVNLKQSCPGDVPVPVLAIHGTEDAVVHHEGNWLYGFQFENPSVAERMEAWATHNGCTGAIDQDAEGVVVTTWTDCDAETELWMLADWEHFWPDIDDPDRTPPGNVHATDEILDFFDRMTISASG